MTRLFWIKLESALGFMGDNHEVENILSLKYYTFVFGIIIFQLEGFDKHFSHNTLGPNYFYFINRRITSE